MKITFSFNVVFQVFVLLLLLLPTFFLFLFLYKSDMILYSTTTLSKQDDTHIQYKQHNQQ